MITVRDICPNCSHLWDEHDEDSPPVWPSSGNACACCIRMGAKAREMNKAENG